MAFLARTTSSMKSYTSSLMQSLIISYINQKKKPHILLIQFTEDEPKKRKEKKIFSAPANSDD